MESLSSLSCCCWRGLLPPTHHHQRLAAASPIHHHHQRLAAASPIHQHHQHHHQHRRSFVILAEGSKRHNPASSAALLAPIAACLIVSACVAPVEAGILSGAPGLESYELPLLPEPDFLKKFQEDNKKKYAGYDSKFKSSPLLEELLKRSKENAEKHKQEIQDKYCIRGAEWGVGDCSTAAMSEEQREAFMEVLKRKGTTQ